MIMRSYQLTRAWATSAILLAVPAVLFGQAKLSLPNGAIGKNLQAFATVGLSAPAPAAGVEITLRSSDTARLLLSRTPLEKGSETLTLKVGAGFRESPEFWLQGQSADGKVSCRASADGYAEGVGEITLTPSAIILSGPFGGDSFQSVTGGPPVKLTLKSVRLDSAGKVAEEQTLAVAPALDVKVISSNGKVGGVQSESIPMKIGTSSTHLEFQTTQEGETTLSATVPDGFSSLVNGGTVTAKILTPGLALSDFLTIGRDLQVAGVLSLGALSPADDFTVTLTSSDPSHLLLSDSATKVGSGTLTIPVRKGGSGATYYLQALQGSGTITYTATARGFRSRTATVTLSPSGIVLTPASQGPPDEAQVMRKDPGEGTHTVSADLRKGSRTPLVAWTVQLDPITRRAADITVQPLRAGVTVKVPLKNSAPNVGKIASALRITGGSEHSVATFEARGPGSTTISVETPGGFTSPANSTSVVAIVSP